MKYKNVIKTCEQIADDMQKDAESIDGLPFNGQTVAKYFGYQAAAIHALANIIKNIATNLSEDKPD